MDLLRETNGTPALWSKGLLLIRLRWLALSGALAALTVALLFGDEAGLRPGPLIVIASLLAVSNVVFLRVHDALHRRGFSRSRFRLYHGLFFAQILADYTSVTILIHQFGFGHINLAILYLPHVILTGIVLERIRFSLLVSVISLLLTAVLAALHHQALDAARAGFVLGDRPYGGALVLTLFNTAITLFVFFLTRILVMEIRRRRNRLIEINRRLIEMDREKQTYTLRATHELKAPFAAIQSYADVILGGYVGELTPKMTDIMEKIKARCVSLSRMIKNIIQLSNLRTTLFKGEDFREVPVEPFLAQFAEKHGDVARGRNIDLVLASEMDDALWIIPDLFAILVDNLIGNAINYSPDGTTITVSVSRPRPGRMTELRVKDQGIGIPTEDLTAIFDEHHRSGNAAELYPSGNGMGLAIVKEAARLHGGAVTVVSEVGVGSEFIVRIPAAPREA